MGGQLVETTSTRTWVNLYKPKAVARFRLIGFPYAGCGASIFSSWGDLLPPDVELVPVQLPGRENRLQETPFADIFLLVETLAAALRPYTDLPFAFFGHSMGALIAYELARYWQRNGDTTPLRVMVSGLRAPHLPSRFPPLHGLPDDTLARELHQRYGGIPAVIMNDPELLRLFLPILRADITIVETYAYRAAEPLNCPLSVFGGQQDTVVSELELAAWSIHTRGTCSLRMFPGNHFFVQSSRLPLLRAICNDLEEHWIAPMG
jgi:medium-chain acyl-[acyl-carrier-protein] hydrolase